MRAGVIIGIILVAAGIYVAAGQGSFKSDKNVLKIGGLEASVKETHAIPPWTGAVAIVAGGVLIFGGMRAKR